MKYEKASGKHSNSLRLILIVVAIGTIVGCLLEQCLHEKPDLKVLKQHGIADNVHFGLDQATEDDSLYGNSTLPAESLNDIRFADFDEDDWFDNEYIRTLRAYLDAFNRGEVEDEELASHRTVVKGQFLIIDVEPSLMGGLQIHFVFVENPESLFRAYVYSDVDIEHRKIVSYAVLYVSVKENAYEFTKEEILDDVKANPQLKLW